MSYLSDSAPKSPRISIGLPVYNGADYLKDAIESILTQTFGDFELIISDNASTDETEKICRLYASRDKRIRYYRNQKNLGLAKNYNRVVELARCSYFKWAAADDLIAPEFLAACIEVLDNNPGILVCHTKVSIIDKSGKWLKDYDDKLHFVSDDPHVRLHDYLFRDAGMWNAIYGLIYTEELRKTRLIESYDSSDQTLLGEIVLRGKIYQIPERLLMRREHAEQGGGTYNLGANAKTAIAIWLDPENRKKIVLPKYVRHFTAYLGNVHRAPLGWNESLLAYIVVIKWALYRFLGLRLMRLAKKLPIVKKHIG